MMYPLLPVVLSMIHILSFALQTECGPAQQRFGASHNKYFDIQGHRGSRGEVVENVLPAFAWGLIDGVNTLELDNGLTKDGVVVVWHDEEITRQKCRDTTPVIANDPDFPYVGKNIANLTLAQIKTLDCGSQRSSAFPLQLTYPGTRISTLREVFAFASCADPNHHISWNIESKINPISPNKTRNVVDFVDAQYEEFVASPYPLTQITYQSFDWRTLIEMKSKERHIQTSALIEPNTALKGQDGTSPWLGGLDLDSFPGSDLGTKIAHAAKSIGADILSPASYDAEGNTADSRAPSFVTRNMVHEAHTLELSVKPWTVNSLDMAQYLIDWGVDGIISDYPTNLRRLVQQRGMSVAPKYPKKRVLECLNWHIQRQL